MESLPKGIKMKSLDGLIKALEEMISLTEDESESEGYFLAMDSIYYLKEYQEHLKWYAYEEHCLAEEKKALHEKSGTGNLPLSWDELQQMEGKPVWIQEGDHGYWIIIDNFSITSYGYHWLNSVEGCLEKEYMGISWQAYRKEQN